MVNRGRSKRTFRRRAAIMTQAVIFGSLVGIGVTAMTIDTGLMYSAKQELQNAADSSALAAAAKLGSTDGAQDAAKAEGAAFASLNEIMGNDADLNIDQDVVFGHAVLSGQKYTFHANETPYDAIRVTLKRDATVSDGPVSLLFAKTFGMTGARLHASATAMLTPRDIALVIDLSGSMNDDSELQHYKEFPSETGGYRDGVQINLEDIWTHLPIAKGNNGVGNGLDPQPPGNPTNYNDQPGTGPGSPNSQGGNPNPGANPSGGQSGLSGPRWGWMTGWGSALALDVYSPATDSGLYYIPAGSTTTDAEVINNLTQAGYSLGERNALLSGANDSNATYYRNRVKVMLGLAGWKSKKSGSKYNGGPGNANDVVDTNELTHTNNYNFTGGGWDNYIDYVRSSSTAMKTTDSNLRYRYGIKTMVNYRLENYAGHTYSPELVTAPEFPLSSVKDAVQTMVDTVVDLGTQDHMSLEVFGTTAKHEINLTGPAEAQLQTIATTLSQRQASYYDGTTNIGGGLDKAILELTSTRARASAAKVIILLTDGKPNVDSSNTYIGDNDPAVIDWCMDRADYAKSHNMTIYTVGVGGDVNPGLLQDIASKPAYYYYADSTPDADGTPLYVQQLQEIFQNLGGKRPVRLIQ